MNKNSVKQRIFLSNTLMMFALLAIFLLINLAVIKIYGESIEHQFVNNASAFLTETEWKNFLKTWTIRQNQFILLFILDGVVCIFVLVAISQFFTKNLVKHIMQPLEALNQGAQRVQENDLTQDIQNEGDREFETVCSTFNAMQKHILNEQEKNHKYEKARMDMLRGISHDLKTPLTAIQGSIKGILDGVVTTPDMQDKFLSAAYRRTNCFIPASLIAISRLYLFVHYPTDILGGIFVGILSGYFGIRLVHYIENWRLKILKM